MTEYQSRRASKQKASQGSRELAFTRLPPSRPPWFWLTAAVSIITGFCQRHHILEILVQIGVDFTTHVMHL